MKILLDNKYIVDMDALSRIVEVKESGDWNSRFYQIVGEPANVSIIQDAQIVDTEEATRREEESAAKKLSAVEKELADLKLKNLRRETVDRILSEKRGVSRSDTEAFMETQTYTWTFSNLTSDDVRKYIRARDEKAVK